MELFNRSTIGNKYESLTEAKLQSVIALEELRNSLGDAARMPGAGLGTSYLCNFNCGGHDFNCEGLNMTV